MQKRPNTWEAVCKAIGRDPKKLPNVKSLPVKHRKHAMASFKLPIIIAFFNGKWIPNYTNENQPKYYPVFQVKATKKRPSGVSLVFGHVFCWYQGSYVGSRLCFEKREDCEFVATQKEFLKIYTDYNLYT